MDSELTISPVNSSTLLKKKYGSRDIWRRKEQGYLEEEIAVIKTPELGIFGGRKNKESKI